MNIENNKTNYELMKFHFKFALIVFCESTITFINVCYRTYKTKTRLQDQDVDTIYDRAGIQ